MSIGIIGAYRVGKTRLCQEFSDKYEVPFMRYIATEVFKQRGEAPGRFDDFKRRLNIQTATLKDYENRIADFAGYAFVTDRTPMDMLTYTLGDARNVELDAEELRDLELYRQRCYELTDKYFEAVVLVQPGIPLVEDDTKMTAPMDVHYIEMLNTLLKGLLADSAFDKPGCFILPRDETRLEFRIEALREIFFGVSAFNDSAVSH